MEEKKTLKLYGIYWREDDGSIRIGEKLYESPEAALGAWPDDFRDDILGFYTVEHPNFQPKENE